MKFTIEWKTSKNTSKNVVNVEICRNPKVGRFAWLRSKVGRFGRWLHLELHKEPVFFFVAFHRLAFSAALKEAEATP